MKRVLSLILAFTLILACAPVILFQADAVVVASGTCGDNLTWTLEDTGTLIISGAGSVSFYNNGYAPWYTYRKQIKTIIVEDTVTGLSSGVFYGLSSLERMTIPFVGSSKKASDSTYQHPFGYIFGTSSYAGGMATKQYYYGANIFSVTNSTYYIPSNLKSVTVTSGEILRGAFYDCSYLTSVTIGDDVTSIGAYAFYDCSSLTDVYYTGVKEQWNAIIIGSYNDNLTNATIHTKESEPVLTGIFVQQKPVKTEYVLGEELDISGLRINGIFSNIGTVEISDGFTVSGFDSSTVGTKTITVTYESFTTTFTVMVDLPMACQNLETGTKYKTLDEALAVITNGTIKLLMNVEADTVILKPGVILDLNGHILTSDIVVVMDDATILDGGAVCTGGGLLKVPEYNLIFARENGQGVIPVWNGVDGYVFTKVIFQQMVKTVGEGAAQYIFQSTFSNAEAAALMVDGGADNGVKIKVGLTWNSGQCQQFYTYSEELVSKVFASEGKLVFSLTITGIAGISDMVAKAIVVTDSGTQATNTSTAIQS